MATNGFQGTGNAFQLTGNAFQQPTDIVTSPTSYRRRIVVGRKPRIAIDADKRVALPAWRRRIF